MSDSVRMILKYHTTSLLFTSVFIIASILKNNLCLCCTKLLHQNFVIYDLCLSNSNHLAVLVAERERQQQMSVDKPDVMSESPAVTSEQSVSVTIETGCTVALQLANEHRQYLSSSSSSFISNITAQRPLTMCTHYRHHVM